LPSIHVLRHPKCETFPVIIIFWIPAKQTALASVWQRAASAEQSKQAEECNIFVYGSSHLSAISLKGADRSEYCFGALITNMPACASTFCTNAKRSARAYKSLLRSRWHLEIYVSSLLPATAYCDQHAHTSAQPSLPRKKRLRENMRA